MIEAVGDVGAGDFGAIFFDGKAGASDFSIFEVSKRDHGLGLTREIHREYREGESRQF
jgi:hypothetical protein